MKYLTIFGKLDCSVTVNIFSLRRNTVQLTEKKFQIGIGGGTVVEHPTHLPKVKGLSPTVSICTVREKIDKITPNIVYWIGPRTRILF
jgi:hypothetical protein